MRSLVTTRARVLAALALVGLLGLACQATPERPGAPRPAPTFTPRPPALPTARVDGVPDFTCRNPRPPAAGFGYGIQSQWSVGDIGYWNRVVGEKLRLSWIKAQVRWREFEPEPGVYNRDKFALLDLWVDDANDRGLNILLSVVDAPYGLRSSFDPAHPEALGPPDDVGEAARFFGLLGRRYRTCAQAIEVWNESNLAREWTTARTLARGGPDAAEFSAFLNTIGPLLKSIDPNLLVIAGGLSPTGASGPGSRDDFVYLAELAAAGGLASVDCVGAHLNGFNLPPDKRYDEGYDDPSAAFRGPFDNPHHSWSFRSTLEKYRSLTGMSVCVTEFGWASMENLGASGAPPGFGFALDNTEAEQAAWIVQGLNLMRDSGAVRLAVVFNLDYIVKSSASPGADSAMPYSLLRKDGAPRPAFDALERMAGR